MEMLFGLCDFPRYLAPILRAHFHVYWFPVGQNHPQGTLHSVPTGFGASRMREFKCYKVGLVGKINGFPLFVSVLQYRWIFMSPRLVHAFSGGWLCTHRVVSTDLFCCCSPFTNQSVTCIDQQLRLLAIRVNYIMRGISNHLIKILA